jgi:putative flippase GtrA
MKNERLKEVGRFMLSGIYATSIDYVVLNIGAVVIGMPLIIANTISATFASIFSYRYNKRVVFEGRMHGRKTSLLLYALVIGSGIIIIQGTIIHLVDATFADNFTDLIRPILDVIGLDRVPDRAISINVSKVFASIVAAFWNYFLLRRYVFVTKSETESD